MIAAATMVVVLPRTLDTIPDDPAGIRMVWAAYFAWLLWIRRYFFDVST